MQIIKDLWQVGGAGFTSQLELKADILCEGHFGVVRGKDEVAGFIRQYL